MTAPATGGERIAKRMARAGLCSRREAERWIAQGRVAVDGETLTTPAVTVTADSRITVDGEVVGAAEATRLWRYHKPVGLVTTNRDPQGRSTVFDALPEHLPRVMSIGRLDLTSEGLLLLTNDGDLARYLELPATGWKRRYRVRVHGRIQEAALAELAQGIEVDGVRYGPIEAALDRQQGANAWLTFSLREGKNREIRHVCEHLGWPVNRLIRTGFGPFQLGSLPASEVDEVAQKVLREQLGGKIDLKEGPVTRAPKAATRQNSDENSSGASGGKPAGKPMAKQAGKRTRKPGDKSGDKSGDKPGARPGGKREGKPDARRRRRT
jgi:23S rRNA pseudouridine2605 synthase